MTNFKRMRKLFKTIKSNLLNIFNIDINGMFKPHKYLKMKNTQRVEEMEKQLQYMTWNKTRNQRH